MIKDIGVAMLNALFGTLCWVVIDALLGVTHDYFLIFVIGTWGVWIGIKWERIKWD